MYQFNSQERFRLNEKLRLTNTINLGKIKFQNICIPKLISFEYKDDIYYNNLYSKVPHHSHR